MSTLEADIRELFGKLADAELPPSQISIGAARRTGQRRRRWRRARLAGTPALAAAGVVAVVISGTLPAGQHAVTDAKHPLRAPATVAAAPARFSTLATYASFGWLPPGEQARSGGGDQLSHFTNLYAGSHFRWQLNMFAAGVCGLNFQAAMVTCQLGDDSRHFPIAGRAPSVNGHQAFWVSAGPGNPPGRQHQEIIWQYAAAGWADLSNAIAADQPSMTLLRIAGGVSFGATGQPLDFAVQLTRVPSMWRVGSDSWRVTSGRMLDNEAAFVTASGDGRDLPFVTVGKAGPGCYFYPDGQSEHDVINGYRVVVNTIPAVRGNPTTYQVCAPDVQGLFVFISVISDRPAVMLTTLFRHLRVLGTNPADWVTSPVR